MAIVAILKISRLKYTSSHEGLQSHKSSKSYNFISLRFALTSSWGMKKKKKELLHKNNNFPKIFWETT